MVLEKERLQNKRIHYGLLNLIYGAAIHRARDAGGVRRAHTRHRNVVERCFCASHQPKHTGLQPPARARSSAS